MAVCGRCGFDHESTGACPVCGAGPEGTRPARLPSGGQGWTIRWLLPGLMSLGFILAALLFYLARPFGLPAAGRPAAGRPDDGGVAVSGAHGSESPAWAPLASPDGAAPAGTAPPAETAPTAPAGASSARPRPAYDITTRSEEPPTDDEQRYVQWMLAHTREEESYLRAKWERAREILQRGDIVNLRILRAFLIAPREYFCRPYNLKRAYADAAMSIGHGQTISGPHMVSRMTQAIDPSPAQRVLEIGTGSGYQSAVLAELSNFVYTIEIVEALAEETDGIYTQLEPQYPEYRNIHRRHADGYYGWEEFAPFDRIIVTCGIDHIPPPLLQQLSMGGIMVIPVGPPTGQTVLKVTKRVNPDGSVELDREDIFHGRRVIFVPFTTGEGGVHSLEGKTEGTTNQGGGQ
jgi:protein-L-isoaspartate(D-aspartate) O-methyltransferase